MLEYVFDKTICFLENMPKSVRKKKGQFFTSVETATYMAEMFDLNGLPASVDILDPGCGTGILSAALIDRLQRETNIKKIFLICYETDPDVIPVLRSNLIYIKKNASISFDFEIKKDDYILSQGDSFSGTLHAEPYPPKYDLVIANPPYLRIMRDDPAAIAMPEVVHGAPNLYFLFAAMSLFNLKKGREMVYIIPRSWTSGAYFRAFRNYFLQEGKIQQIHLFISRDKVFTEEQVLQETIIIKMKKAKTAPDNVIITSSQSNRDFNDVSVLKVPYDSVVVGEELYVFLPISSEEVAAVNKINTFSSTFPDIGLRMKTGIVVDFRQWEDLRSEPGDHTVPLFYSQHIRNGRVGHQPSGKNCDWIVDTKPGLIQRNKSYVFCKRFTAKEERRRLQCGIYLAEDFPQYHSISTQNKINYVDSTIGEDLSKEVVYGVYALLNSTLFDTYYRVLDGSTQVNSTEINNIPVPPLCVIADIGKRLMQKRSLSTATCDELLNEVYT